MALFPQLLYACNKLRWRLTKPLTLGVRLILAHEDAVVLVKHTYQRHWYLPGGGVQKGETLEEAAQREAAEELGAELTNLRLFGVYTNFYENKNDHVVVFSCDTFSYSGQSDHEIAEINMFKMNALPDDLSPGSRRRIQEYQTYEGHPKAGSW